LNAVQLLNDLRGRGAEVRIAGEQLVVRVPRGSASAELRRTIAAHKQALVALLASGDALEEAPVTDVEPAAYRLRTRRFGDVWLVPDEGVSDFRRSHRAGDLPVISFTEIVRLRGKSVAAIRAVLEAKRAFPEARVLH
jgi:hypothetical protein